MVNRQILEDFITNKMSVVTFTKKYLFIKGKLKKNIFFTQYLDN